MKIYVINLDRSPERWQTISRQLEQLGLPFERITAVDGATLDLTAVADNNACRSYMGRDLTLGEAGCFLSHVRALNTFLSTDDEYAVVLEDDVILSDDFTSKLDFIIRSVAALPHGIVSAVNLGPSDYKYTSQVAEENGQSLLCAHRFPMMANGLIWTRKGAERVCAAASPIILPYDNFLRVLFTGNIEGFSVLPPMTWPSGAESDINTTDSTTPRAKSNRRRGYFFIRNRRMLKEKLHAAMQMLHWRLRNPLNL